MYGPRTWLYYHYSPQAIHLRRVLEFSAQSELIQQFSLNPPKTIPKQEVDGKINAPVGVAKHKPSLIFPGLKFEDQGFWVQAAG